MEELLNKITFNIKKINSNIDGANYKIRINVPMELGFIERMKFITETNSQRSAYQLHHLKNENGFVSFEGEIFLKREDLYLYYFSFEANHMFIYLKKNNVDNFQSVSKYDMWSLSSSTKYTDSNEEKRKADVYNKVPDWAQGKIMYQIFVDRFNRGNKVPLKEMRNRTIHQSWNEDVIVGPNENGLWCTDYYGGDLVGITEKLDYIKSLGVGIIYLTPIVYSQSNHRYDASDYEMADPYVGSYKDLKELCDKAHSMDIKIVLDSVFNHTGNDSKYFNQFNSFPELGAYQSPNSKYYPFFRKSYGNGNVYFYYWWDQKNMPVCDGYSKEWQDYIYGEGGIIDKWFKLGIDGLRLDVADELTDQFIEGIRRAVKRNKEDGFILGEVWENPMRKGRRFMKRGSGLDSVMNYLLMNALIRYYKYGEYDFLNHIINEIIREYPKDTVNSLMNFTSTHDISRVLNILGSNEFDYHGNWAWNLPNETKDNQIYQQNVKLSKEEYELAKKIYKSYLLVLTYLPGNLSIFAGDEIGMQGLGNLCNRRSMDWNNIDYDILNSVRDMGKLRNENRFLEKANLQICNINSKTISFIRKLDNKESYVLVSRVGTRERVEIPVEYQDAIIDYKINDSNKEELSEYGGIVLKKIR